MKNFELKLNKKNIKRIFIGLLALGVFTTNISVYATEDTNLEDIQLEALYTEDFVEWQNLSEEEQQETVLPQTYATFVSDETIEEYSDISEAEKEYRAEILTGNLSIVNSVSDATVKASYSSASYNLNNTIDVEVKNQGSTNQCWAFSMLSSLETNLALTENVYKTFSARHMAYATSITPFTDGTNSAGYNKDVKAGGLATLALAYLTNGQGAVLESDMPFEDNEDAISLSDLEKDVDTIVTDYTSFPAIYKEYASDGTVTYTNGGSGSSKVTYTSSEVTAMRNAIKNHIINYGGISAVTAGNQYDYYNNSNISEATAYFCNDNTITRDHAITIIGWDDNYSKENFTGSAKPSTDGAYIVLNTYGTSNFNDGYLYISYEDALIETFLYGIVTSSSVDYDVLYQYNPLGDNVALGASGTNTAYIANVYTRDVSESEALKYVGITLTEDSSVEIYVNPSGNSTTLSGLTQVASTDVLTAGYHRIAVNTTRLTGNSFAIVVKITSSSSSHVYFSVEAAISNSIYSTVTGNPGKCLYSLDGSNWYSISDVEISGIDMTTADTCVKAFTEYVDPLDDEEEEEITLTSDTYYITSSDIYKITYKTTYATFQSNISTNAESYAVYDSDGNTIDNNDLIKTGMTLVLSDGSTYTLIVRGDTNSSGTISLIDFSRFISNYSEVTSFRLTGAELKAADLNCDGKISSIDLSQMIVLFMSV